MASKEDWENYKHFRQYYIGFAFGAASGFMFGLSFTADDPSQNILIALVIGLLGVGLSPVYTSGKFVDKLKKATIGIVIGFVVGLIIAYYLLQHTATL